MDNLIEKARNSLSKYCIEECKAYCCRKGYLPLTEEQVNLIMKKTPPSKIADSVKKFGNNKYSLNMGISGCPMLKDFKCTIHNNPKRPECCRVFPLFIEGNVIKLSPRCPAVKAGKLYPYIAQLLKQGYVLDKREFIDFEPV